MRISELAGCVEESTRTIRFYESIGLLSEPPRAPNGYREYDRHAIGQIRLIRTLQCAGFSLEDISTLFALRRCACRATDDDRMFIADKQAQLDARLETFTRIRGQLSALAITSDCADPPKASEGKGPGADRQQPRHLVGAR